MLPILTDVETIKSLLNRRSITVSRSLGQNFLISAEVVEAMAAVAKEAGVQQVTELGPGLGAITQALVMNGLAVRAIEKDDDFAEMLPAVVPPKVRERLEVVHEDLKKADWSWEEPYQVIGNIPYNLSGLIIRRVTQLEPAPAQALLLVQREVGERMREVPSDMNLMSLAVQLWGQAELLMHVPAHCFWPQPKVHSELVRLTPHSPEIYPLEQREAIMQVARLCFQQKRKQLGGVLRSQYAEKLVAAALQAAGVAGDQRPQELTVEQWVQLENSLK